MVGIPAQLNRRTAIGLVVLHYEGAETRNLVSVFAHLKAHGFEVFGGGKLVHGYRDQGMVDRQVDKSHKSPNELVPLAKFNGRPSRHPVIRSSGKRTLRTQVGARCPTFAVLKPMVRAGMVGKRAFAMNVKMNEVCFQMNSRADGHLNASSGLPGIVF